MMAVAESISQPIRGARPRSVSFFLLLPVLLIVAASGIVFFNFTAEDAYITYRYAENLVDTGALVYNLGEPINAMTSPLHAALSTALFYLTGHTVLANKILAVLLLLLSSALVWCRFRNDPPLQLLALVLILTPPAVMLWTLGGLETPLLLFLVTLAVCLASRAPPFSLNSLCGLFLIAGLAFVTRYDSILFFLPVLLYATWQARSARHVLMAILVGAMLPAAWLAVSYFYYGDLLPTSFYVKTPNGNLGTLLYNGIYVLAYLFNVGIVPVLAAALILVGFPRKGVEPLTRHFRSLWWLYVALLLELAYGLTIATHHMMFSFRFFVPYLPAFVVLVVDLVRRAAETSAVDLSSGRTFRRFLGLLVCLTIFQVYQIAFTYDHSVNGISPVGEYRSVSVRDYLKFMEVLRQQAFDIERHWNQTRGDQQRLPRILTYAAGMLPYTFRESYIYEKLVSYRHCHQRYQQGRHADYLHIVAPRLGPIAQQLPQPENEYALISSYEMQFDGSSQHFLVYYNPAPEDHNLTATVYQPCQQGETAMSDPTAAFPRRADVLHTRRPVEAQPMDDTHPPPPPGRSSTRWAG